MPGARFQLQFMLDAARKIVALKSLFFANHGKLKVNSMLLVYLQPNAGMFLAAFMVDGLVA